MSRKKFKNLAQLRSSKTPALSTAEMYCGPGGIALGASQARVRTNGRSFTFKHAWATDNDGDTCATYERNILKGESKGSVILANVQNLDLESLPPTDGFMYGFPCNDFSNVGETRGLDGDFGPLYKYGVNLISLTNPLFFLAENVTGLSSANSGKAFSKILEELASAGQYGYKLTTHLYKFEEYGLPQARHRYIIVGLRSDLGLTFRVPRPSYKLLSCRQAIENPPISHDAHNHEFTSQSKTVIERLMHIRPGENAWTADLPERLKLNVKGAKLSQIYKRLDPDKPSYTITGSGGGGTHVYHWSEPRALTNRERARLQTFPDNFVFVGSKESVRKQIGMAVPPEAARIILTAVLKTLAGVNYRTIEPSRGYLLLD